MFTLFFSLYASMFLGQWKLYTIYDIKTTVLLTFDKLGELITSIFNDSATPITDLGTMLTNAPISSSSLPNYLGLVAFILALITSIGIVVMAVKGVKKAFGIFFMGIR